MQVPKNQKKTKTDAWNGFHSVEITEEDRSKTTFITQWGRFRYRGGTQGYLATGDAYTRRFDELTVDITNKTKCIDDKLSWNTTIEEAFWDHGMR